MPEGIGGMVSLQNLSNFKAQKWSHLQELTELSKRLRGYLFVTFDMMAVGDEQRWQLPGATSLQYLKISNYPGHRILGWGNNESKMKLEHLNLYKCYKVKYLPSMRCLPGLKWLVIGYMAPLESMEETEEVNPHNPTTFQKFFPCLEKLELFDMPKLKGWRKKSSCASAFLEFSHLSELKINNCPNFELSSFPECPHLLKLQLCIVATSSAIFFSSNCSSLEEIRITQCKWQSGIPGEALTSLRLFHIAVDSSLKSLHLASTHLLDLVISSCDELVSIELAQRPSLRLKINNCKQMKSLHIEGRLIAGVEEMETKNCLELSSQKDLPKVEAYYRKLKLKNLGSVVMKWSLLSLSTSSLRVISIYNCKGSVSLPCMELTSLERCHLNNIDGLQSLHIPSPHLQYVTLKKCMGLTSIEVKSPTKIDIICCSEMKNFRIAEPTALRSLQITSPSSVDWASVSNLYQCSCLTRIDLDGVNGVFIVRLLSSSPLPSLEYFFVKNARGLKILNFKSPYLKVIRISYCSELTSVELESPFTCSNWMKCDVAITDCSQLNNVRIPRPIALLELEIDGCPELRLSTGVDWDSITNLEMLRLLPLPPVEEVLLQLPQYLQQRHAQLKLQIEGAIFP